MSSPSPTFLSALGRRPFLRPEAVAEIDLERAMGVALDPGDAVFFVKDLQGRVQVALERLKWPFDRIVPCPLLWSRILLEDIHGRIEK